MGFFGFLNPLVRAGAALCLGAVLFSSSAPSEAKEIPQDLVKAAKGEGKLYTVGMPDDWANWKDTWRDLKSLYGIEHQDTDMSSAQEIAKFAAEGKNATADLGDVGIAFGPIAVKKGVTQPYKTSYWNEIPSWAKDREGHWIVGYTGTIAFLVNKDLVKVPPRSWRDLLKGDYKVTVGDVGVAAQANSAVLACAYALGGDERNIKPAIDFFAQLAKAGRLSTSDPSIAMIEKGEVAVGLMWDFNALNYADKVGRQRFEILIPSDGSLISGYATIINRWAKNPNAAKLAREFILSDRGQINLARGYARPIRTSVKLPEDVRRKLLPQSQYTKARPIKDFGAWENTTAQLQRLWQENVLIHVNR
jgi:putative spermidine/putrescine transport system substrate-binding protein